MALIEITDVALAELYPERMMERSIEVPEPSGQSDTHTIDIGGWVLGHEALVTAVHVIHDGVILRTAPLLIERPDVQASFPQLPGVESCGFWVTVSLVGMAPSFTVSLEAEFEDGGCVPLATIRGRHEPVRTTFPARLQPLMVTNLGRSGSTLLMQMLIEHPRVVGHRLYPYETRSAGYWMHMLRVLSEPGDHQRSAHPNTYQENFWWVGQHPHYMEPVTDPPAIADWFGRDYVEDLATFCQRSSERFYERVAADQGVADPIYFAEKHHPMHTPWVTWGLYPGAREIILVRDFRDMICSMLDWYRKRGLVSFGRDEVDSDLEFVRTLRQGALRLLRSWQQRSDRALLVHYEDLVTQPVPTLTSILEYLELDRSPATVARMLRQASKDTPELRQHRTTKDVSASIGRWQRDLSPHVLAVCQEALGDVLEAFGYRAAAPAVPRRRRESEGMSAAPTVRGA